LIAPALAQVLVELPEIVRARGTVPDKDATLARLLALAGGPQEP